MTYIYGSVMLPHINNTILWIYLILGLVILAKTVNDFILFVGQWDLYFMVRGFFIIFLSLFNGFKSYLD